MPTDPIRAALEAAKKRLCMCDGECFETRHGMMNGPCEADMRGTAAAIAAFLEALPSLSALPVTDGFERVGINVRRSRALAAAVRRAAGGG